MALSRNAQIALAAVVAVAVYSVWVNSDRSQEPDLPPAPEARDLAAGDGDRDVRIAYRTVGGAGWDTVDRLELSVSRLEVDYIVGERGCHDPTYLSLLTKDGRREASRKRQFLLFPVRPQSAVLPVPPLPDPVVYGRDYAPRTLILRLGTGLLDLPALNRLPNGFITELRLFVDSASVVRDMTRTDLEVPALFRTDGLRLVANDGLVPVCERFITSIGFDLKYAEWLIDKGDTLTLLGDLAELKAEDQKGRLVGEATSPEAVYPGIGGRLDIPDGLLVQVPQDAVSHPMVIRVREMGWRS